MVDNMVTIQPLTYLEDYQFKLIEGYTTHSVYVADKSEQEEQTSITLRLQTLASPQPKRFDPPTEDIIALYREALTKGFSFAAYDAEQTVGIALADAQRWNRSLWVWEFHVAPSHQGQGIGRQLMERLAEAAKAAGLRIIVCETQSTNVPAIQFYRRAGFTIEGIDLSYYTNEDMEPGREVAVFMKRRVG
jgi:ribosomal protein S18 acetylase RimI-like enzyme